MEKLSACCDQHPSNQVVVSELGLARERRLSEYCNVFSNEPSSKVHAYSLDASRG